MTTKFAAFFVLTLSNSASTSRFLLLGFGPSLIVISATLSERSFCALVSLGGGAVVLGAVASELHQLLIILLQLCEPNLWKSSAPL